MNFSRYAKNVIMLVRGNNLGATMSQYLINDIAQTPNIRVEYEMEVVAVHGEAKLEAVSISCSRTGTVDTVPATGLFVFIGAEPRTGWLDGFVERDARGFSLPGRRSCATASGRPAGPWTATRSCWRPASPVSLRWATSVMVR